MKLISTLLFLHLTAFLFAQYQPLQCEGDIPKDFTVQSTAKYKEELENVDRDAKRRTQKYQKEFFLENHFGVDDLLKSGYVLFNDPVSNYITEVAGKVLESEPKLKDKLRFYAVRSSTVNAFATNPGVILVTMGLIAQLENEAQLAFILAHEISHYTEKHSLEFYVESKTIDRSSSRKLLERTNFDDKIMAKSQFSKEQELEADEEGIKLFLKTDYNVLAIHGVFDVLQYAHTPFDDKKFVKSFFEDEFLIFPQSLELTEIKEIEANVGEVENSTHPSIETRREKATAIMKETSAGGTNDFLIGATRFKEIRNTARYELMNYNLRDYDYYRAIYNAYLLSQNYPDDLYLKEVIAKALYGIAKFKNEKEFYNIKTDHEEIQGELAQLAFFINEINNEEFNAFAIRYLYLLKSEFEGDAVYRNRLEDLCADMVSLHESLLSKFKTGKPDSLALIQFKIENESDSLKNAEGKWEYEVGKENLEESKQDEGKEESKYDKLKKQREAKEATDSYIYYAFGDFLEKEDFKKLLEKGRERAEKKQKEQEEFEAYKQTKYYRKGGASARGDFSLGESKITVISPMYLKLKKGLENQDYLKTEKAQNQFNSILVENADRVNLKLNLLDVNNFSSDETEEFNDLMVINEWFSHHLGLEEDMKMIAFNQEDINRISEKYKTDSFLWIGVISGRTTKNAGKLAAEALFHQFGFLYHLFSVSGQSILFSYVVNSSDGEPRMGSFDYIASNDNTDVLNQRVYDILWQINRKAKKKK